MTPTSVPTIIGTGTVEPAPPESVELADVDADDLMILSVAIVSPSVLALKLLGPVLLPTVVEEVALVFKVEVDNSFIVVDTVTSLVTAAKER